MTVNELMRSLQKLGIEKQDLPVIIRGYESGSNDVSEVEEVEIAVDHHKGQPYNGRHRVVDDEMKKWILEDSPNRVFAKAIHLSGSNPR